MKKWSLVEVRSPLARLVQRVLDKRPDAIVAGTGASVTLTQAHQHAFVDARPSLKDLLLAGPPFPDEMIEAMNRERDRAPACDLHLDDDSTDDTACRSAG